MTTTRSSAVKVTSISAMSAPIAIASRMAATVFSGARPENPRWATTQVRPPGSRNASMVIGRSPANAMPVRMRVRVATKDVIRFINALYGVHGRPHGVTR